MATNLTREEFEDFTQWVDFVKNHFPGAGMSPAMGKVFQCLEESLDNTPEPVCKDCNGKGYVLRHNVDTKKEPDQEVCETCTAFWD